MGVERTHRKQTAFMVAGHVAEAVIDEVARWIRDRGPAIASGR